MKLLAYFFSVFFLVASVLPAAALAAPGNTPPWTTEAAATPNGVAICTAQKGIGKELCLQNQMGTTTTAQYTQPVNGACPVAGTVKVIKCEVDPNAASTGTNTTGGASTNSGGGFKPLTNIQNVTFAGNAAELPDFLNSIYMICIGLAAVIGVLQIMRAGVTWMTAGGSHEKIGDAKNLIRDTIIGLILVLAPTIVFSIINPDILKLQIRGLSDLQTKLPAPATGESSTESNLNDLGQVSNGDNDAGGKTIAPPPTAPGCSTTIRNSQIISDSNKDLACCASQTNGYAVCKVQARTRMQNDTPTSVTYCGCSIRPNLGMEYYDLYSAPFYQTVGKLRYETDLKKLGTTPPGTAEKFNTFQKGCTDAGGKFEVKSTRNILQSKYIVCPADSGAPESNTETVYRCMPMKATCTSQ